MGASKDEHHRRPHAPGTVKESQMRRQGMRAAFTTSWRLLVFITVAVIAILAGVIYHRQATADIPPPGPSPVKIILLVSDPNVKATLTALVGTDNSGHPRLDLGLQASRTAGSGPFDWIIGVTKASVPSSDRHKEATSFSEVPTYSTVNKRWGAPVVVFKGSDKQLRELIKDSVPLQNDFDVPLRAGWVGSVEIPEFGGPNTRGYSAALPLVQYSPIQPTASPWAVIETNSSANGVTINDIVLNPPLNPPPDPADPLSQPRTIDPNSLPQQWTICNIVSAQRTEFHRDSQRWGNRSAIQPRGNNESTRRQGCQRRP